MNFRSLQPAYFARRIRQMRFEKAKRGGLLILDNSNRYIPNRQLGGAGAVHEPRSEPRSAVWARILDQLKEGRWINTTDGIWDTRFWIKPL
jgi:hypothetical protein